MKRLNIKLLLILGVLFVGGGVGTVLLHGYQLAKTAHTRKERADEARENGDTVEEYKQLARYLQHKPEDTETYKRYLVCLKDNLFTGKIKPRKLELQQLLAGLESAIRKNPNDVTLRQESIEFWMAVGVETEAIDHLEQLEQLDSLRPKDIIAWAHIETKLGDVDAATKRLSELIGYDPVTNTFSDEDSDSEAYTNLQAYWLLADLYKRQMATTDSYDIPNSIMQKMIDRNSSDPKAYLLRARYLASVSEGTDRARAGLADIEQALNVARDNADVISEASSILMNVREYDRAGQLLATGLEKYPDDWRMYTGQARLHILRKEPSSAVAILDKGLNNPKLKLNEELLVTRCNAHLEMDDLKRAKETHSLIVQNKKVPKFNKDLLSAKIELADDNITEATSILKRLLPNAGERFQGEVTSLLERCYRLSGQGYLAEELRKGRKGDNKQQAKLDRARDLLNQSEFREALTLFGELAKEVEVFKVPGEPQNQFIQEFIGAHIRYQTSLPEERRNWSTVDKMAAAYVSAAKLSPAEAEVFQIKLLNSKGNRRDARRMAEQAALRQPRNPSFWLLYVGLTRDNQQALNILRRMEENVGDLPVIRLEKGERIARINPPDAVQQLEQQLVGIDGFDSDEQFVLRTRVANQLVMVNAFDSAFAVMGQLLQEKPNDMRLIRNVYDIALEAGNEQKMDEMLDKIESLAGRGSAEFLVQRARRTMWQIKNKGVAKSKLAGVHSDLDTAQARQQSWDMIPAVRAEAFKSEQKYLQAVNEYKRALDLNPSNAKYLNSLSQLLMETGQFAEAQKYLDQVPEEAKSIAQIRNGILMSAKADPQGALERAKQVVSADTADPDELIFLAQLFNAAGQKKKATAAYQRATEVSPENSKAWILLMQHLRINREFEAGAAAIQRLQVSAIEPKRMALLLGQACTLMNRLDEAKQHYREASNLDPESSIVMRNIIQLTMQDGDTTMRDEFLNKLIALDPSTPEDKINVKWGRRTQAQLLLSAKTYPEFQKAVALIEQNKNDVGELTGEDLIIWLELHAKRPEADSRAKAAAKISEIERDRVLNSYERMIQARLYKAAGRWSDAKSTMQSLVTREGNNPSVIVPFVEWLLERGDRESLREASSLLQLLPDTNSDKLRLSSIMLVKQGRSEIAYRQLKSLIPDNLPESQNTKIREVARMMNLLGEFDPKFYVDSRKLWERYIRTLKEPYGELPMYAAFLMDIPDDEDSAGKNIKNAFVQSNKFVKREIGQKNWGRVLTYVSIGIDGIRKHRRELPLDSPYYRVVQTWLDALTKANFSPEDTLIQQAFLSDLQQDYARVEKSYRDYLKLPNPNAYNKGVVRNNLAYLLATTGKGAEAIRVVEDAIASLGVTAALRDTRAMAYIDLKQYDKAIADLTAIEDAGEASPSTFFHLAIAKLRQGDEAGATTDMNRSIELGLVESDLAPVELKIYNEIVSRLGISTSPAPIEVSAVGS